MLKISLLVGTGLAWLRAEEGLPAAPVKYAESPYSSALRTKHPAETALIRGSRLAGSV